MLLNFRFLITFFIRFWVTFLICTIPLVFSLLLSIYYIHVYIGLMRPIQLIDLDFCAKGAPEITIKISWPTCIYQLIYLLSSLYCYYMYLFCCCSSFLRVFSLFTFHSSSQDLSLLTAEALAMTSVEWSG